MVSPGKVSYLIRIPRHFPPKFAFYACPVPDSERKETLNFPTRSAFDKYFRHLLGIGPQAIPLPRLTLRKFCYLCTYKIKYWNMGAFLKISGDYTTWNVYRKAVIICDVTEMFINRALPRGSRTIDQMRQAARSCKQNIVEGVSDGAVSYEMCIKLLGVARGWN